MLPDRMNAVVGMHRDMNFTMIRNWIGPSDREELFAACNANGIVVCNEFWDAFSIDPANLWLALAAGPQPGIQECGDHGGPPRGAACPERRWKTFVS